GRVSRDACVRPLYPTLTAANTAHLGNSRIRRTQDSRFRFNPAPLSFPPISYLYLLLEDQLRTVRFLAAIAAAFLVTGSAPALAQQKKAAEKKGTAAPAT